MSKPKLTVIKGGLSSPKESEEKYFISAYVTDTRLMGVIGLYIHWRLPSQYATPDFHQFFYLDAEEFGFETYKSLLGNDVEEIAKIEQALIGGLGGKKIEISERESRYLLCEYTRMNNKRGLPLPDGQKEYQFLTDNPTILNPNEQSVLMRKICGELTSDYQVINYFLMRCFCHDYEAAAFLTDGTVSMDIFQNQPTATLCKNIIDKKDDIYMCESLIEYHDKYTLVISELTLQDLTVTDITKRSGFSVSAMEAAMMLSRPEFITIYEVLLSPEDFDNNISELTLNTMMTSHENGRLFLSFHKNNDHVNKKVFRLSEDIFGLYYATDYGQLVVSSYSLAGIHAMERDLRKSVLAPFLMATAKYEFKEPVLYEFIQSDFEDFNDFLDYIKNE